MILAETTPGSVRISSSARLIGRTLPAMLFKFKLCGILMGAETGGQYCRRLSVNQAKNPATRPCRKSSLTAERQRVFRVKIDAKSFHRNADSFHLRSISGSIAKRVKGAWHSSDL